MILDLDTRESVRMPSAADGSDWLGDRTLIVDATVDWGSAGAVAMTVNLLSACYGVPSVCWPPGGWWASE